MLFRFRSEHVKKYIQNSGWLVFDFIVRTGINVFVGIYVARYLQPDKFGLISYASTFYQLLVPLAYLGLNGVVVRELMMKESSDRDKILGTAFWLKAAASLISFLLILGIIQFSESDYITKVYIVIVSLSFFVSPFQVIDFFFQSKVQSKYVVYSQQIASITCGAVRLLLVYLQADLIYFVFMISLEVIISTFFFLVYYKLKGNKISLWQYDRVLAKALLKEIPPLIMTGFFIIIYLKIDQILIKNMMDANSLGYYTAAVKLCEPFYVVSTLIMSSFYPAIINGRKISEEEYRKRLQRLYNILTWIAIMVSVIVFFVGDLVIRIVYGPLYLGAIPVLKLYFWASIFVFQGVVASQAFVVEKLQKFGTIYTLFGALLNILLNILLIPKYGISGSAWATIISYACSATLFNSIFKPTRIIFKQQMSAFTAVITKPRGLIQQFYVKQNDT